MVLAVSWAAYYNYADSGDRPPIAMTGDLNIVVAPITADGHASVDGTSLARDSYRVLRSTLGRLDDRLHVDIAGPDDRRLLESKRYSDGADPGKLADGLNADLVVYGDLHNSGDATVLTPRFSLNARKLPTATELVGRYSYGPPLEEPFGINVNPQARAHLRARLVRRASTFATIFVAVGYYLQDDFSKAETYFKTALSRAHGQPVEPLLLLFLGNIANQRHQPHRAARYYTGALRLAPGYGRARFGLAEVQYALGKHDCSPRDVDAPMLRRARAAFGKVPLADLRLDSARAALVLAAKVQFGVAQVDLCLSHAEVTSRWQQARRGFRAVIRAYASRRSELRDDAAEAHAGLGLSYLVLRTRSGYRVAQREYRAAAETTTIDQRAAYFYRMLGYADRLLGDPAGVRDARRRSDLLTP